MSRNTNETDPGAATRAGPAADAAAVTAALRQAQAYHQAGRLAEAVALCRQVLSVSPRDFDALHLGAMLEFQLGRPAQSLQLIERALGCNPRSAHAIISRGLVLQALGRHAEALAAYEQALAIQPRLVEAHYHRGNALHDLQRPGEAVASYERALALRPDYVEALYNRGLVLQELARHQEALDSYARAVSLRPELADAHYNRGLILHEMKRYDEAVASYDQALRQCPGFADALNNRGNSLRCLNRYDEAIASLDHALRLRPGYVEAWINRGLALQGLGRCEAALESFGQALALRPDSAEAHCGASLCRLSRGDFAAGWEEYEWRWLNPRAERPRAFAEPRWRGTEPLAGKTVLLWAEQGLGDTLQFCRYAHRVAELGARVVLEVQPALRPLLAGLAGPAQVLAQGEPLPPFDYHCPLLSLPLAFGTTLDSVPAGGAYLGPDKTKRQEWQRELAGLRRPRIGLAWSGDPRHPNDRNRSMRLAELQPLLAMSAEFIVVQKDVREEDRAGLAAQPGIRQFDGRLRDFADTAALVNELDLVITVDTSIAHLAGALGKPVWILLCSNPDWRWMQDREDSPWYPTARLFRQNSAGDWRGVIERVVQRLTGRPDPAR